MPIVTVVNGGRPSLPADRSLCSARLFWHGSGRFGPRHRIRVYSTFNASFPGIATSLNRDQHHECSRRNQAGEQIRELCRVASALSYDANVNVDDASRQNADGGAGQVFGERRIC
jgi:hypothetical protein